MEEISMNRCAGISLKSVFKEFVISKTAQGVSESTLNNYKYHMRSISRYLDVDRSFDSITKRDVEKVVVAMRKKGLSHNSIQVHFFPSFIGRSSVGHSGSRSPRRWFSAYRGRWNIRRFPPSRRSGHRECGGSIHAARN